MVAIQPPAATVGVAPEAAPAALREAAQEFEAVFLAQMLDTLSRGLGRDGAAASAGLFGGEGPFQDLLSHEIGRLISRTGGIGIADAVLQEMLKMQEIA